MITYMIQVDDAIQQMLVQKALVEAGFGYCTKYRALVDVRIKYIGVNSFEKFAIWGHFNLWSAPCNKEHGCTSVISDIVFTNFEYAIKNAHKFDGAGQKSIDEEALGLINNQIEWNRNNETTKKPTK